MNAMIAGDESKAIKALPKRSAFIFFPNGVSLPPAEHEHYEDWYWFPKGEGRNYQFRENLKALTPYKNDISVISGLSNPGGRTAPPHVGPTGFLTTARITKKSRINTVSIDQEIVSRLNLGRVTPVESLVISTQGGVGSLGRTQTMSYNANGIAIPSLSNLKSIYEKMYAMSGPERAASLKNKEHLLDCVLEDAKDFNKTLGKEDKVKLDEYLSALRDVEKKVENDKFWYKIMSKKKNEVNESSKMDLNVTSEDAEKYIQTIYDLMYMAFKTDLTRVATYQLAVEGGAQPSGNLSKYVGMSKDLHALSHGSNKSPEGFKDWGQWDQFVGKQLAYFIKRLHDTKEGDSRLLDRCLVFQGCATGKLHDNHNYPLILAGGKEMGHKTGQYVKYVEEDNALSNLYVRIGQAMGAPIKKFGDSTGISMSELFV